MALFKQSHPGMVATALSVVPTPIPANSVQIETYTLKGMTPEHMLHIGYPLRPAGLLVLDSWCDAPDTFKIAWWNVTSQPIDPGTAILQAATR